MTEFTPLAESAASSVLLVLLGLPTAFRTPGFRRELGKQLRITVMFTLHAFAWITGKTLGTLAAVASAIIWMAYILADLWSPRLAAKPWNLWQSLIRYCGRRQFYQAQHAA